jgi:hypothetical protein
MSERDLATQIDSSQACVQDRIIPPDYERTVTAGRNADVIFILDGSDPSVASSALSLVRLIGVALTTRVPEETLVQHGATSALMPGVPQVRERVWYNPDMDSAVFVAPGLIGLVLQFPATLLTASAVVRELQSNGSTHDGCLGKRVFNTIAGSSSAHTSSYQAHNSSRLRRPNISCKNTSGGKPAPASLPYTGGRHGSMDVIRPWLKTMCRPLV